MNHFITKLALIAALLLTALPSRLHAQVYECADSLGTNCSTPLNDGYSQRYTGVPLVGTTTSSLIVLPGACDASDVVADVDLSVDIVHPYVGDLELSLRHPDGTTVTLLFRPGVGVIDGQCPSDDLSVTIDDEEGVAMQACEHTIPAIGGTILPFNPLSAFDGKARNGTWTLTINDVADGNAGVLSGWTLHLPCTPDVPSVSFEVTDGVLYEDGDDTTATVTVVRTGDMAGALDVDYTVSGTATTADYEALSGMVTIPAGSPSATIEITSVDDDLAEIAEVMVFRFAPSDAYGIGAGDSATVTLLDGDGETSDGGCGCSVRNTSEAPLGMVALLGLGLVVRRRRSARRA